MAYRLSKCALKTRLAGLSLVNQTPRETFLNAAAPVFIGRLGRVRREIFPTFIDNSRRLIRRDSAQHAARHFRVSAWIVSLVASMGGDGRALRHVQAIRSPLTRDSLYRRSIHRASIGTRCPRPGPQVRSAAFRESRDGPSYAGCIPAAAEPEAPAQALVERSSPICRKSLIDGLPVHKTLPVKEALVETVAVQHRPPEKGMYLRRDLLDPQLHPR